MTDKMFKLSDKYANLLIEVWETHIKAIIRDNHRTILYGNLLEPGTMVYYKSRLWFYSKQQVVGVLHGTWTSTDGETKSVYDFLTDILNYGRPVEVAFDVRQFIPKETW